MHSQALCGAFPFEVLLQPGAKTAGMGADNIVVARIVIGRALKDGLSDQPLIQVVAFSVQRLLADIKKKGGEAIRIDEPGTRDDSLDEQPPWVTCKRGVRGTLPLISNVHDTGILVSSLTGFNELATEAVLRVQTGGLHKCHTLIDLHANKGVLPVQR